jgi:hypothetical protein
MELAAKSIRGVAGLMSKEFKWIMQWLLDIADGMVFDIGTAVSWFGAHSDELTPFLEGHLGSELIRMSLPLFSTSYGCCTERYRHSLRMVSADCFEINRKVSKQWFLLRKPPNVRYIYG